MADEAHRLTVEGLSRAEMAQVASEPRLATAHFIVAYPSGDAADARVVADSLERYYPQVTAQLQARPTGRVPVRVEPPAVMASIFHTSEEDPPLGAYWRGVLWFLSPSSWLDGSGTSLAAAFDREGPAPHEFAHLLDDLRTDGRLPGWLDEGIAQYVEWRANGYLWLDPDNRLNQPLYSWHQLETSFDSLDNQALAYRQSFLVVRAIGPAAINRLLSDVGAGQSADAALRQVVGAQRYRALVDGAAWHGGTEAAAGKPGRADRPA